MTDDSWFVSTMDLVGLHLHVLGAAAYIGRMEKLHYFISFLPLIGTILYGHVVSDTE